MTAIDCLNAFKAFTENVIKDEKLPVKPQENDVTDPPDKTPDVYLMRLPDSTSAKKKAPYILHQFVTGSDTQSQGQSDDDIMTVRTVFCVYDQDEQRGALSLLELIERLRIALLKSRIIDKRFELSTEQGESLERMVYSEDTAPYYVGEMVSTWKLPSIEREVTYEQRDYF